MDEIKATIAITIELFKVKLMIQRHSMILHYYQRHLDRNRLKIRELTLENYKLSNKLDEACKRIIEENNRMNEGVSSD